MMKRKALMFCIATLLVCSYADAWRCLKKTPHIQMGVRFLMPVRVPAPESNPESAPESAPESNPELDNTNLEDTALTALQKEINQSGSAAGIAFIGYVDSESSEVDLRAYYASSETGKAYPDLVYAPLYMAEGQELYAIIPPNDKGTIIVYPP